VSSRDHLKSQGYLLRPRLAMRAVSLLNLSRVDQLITQRSVVQIHLQPTKSAGDELNRTQLGHKTTVWNQKLAGTARSESTESTDMVGERGLIFRTALNKCDVQAEKNPTVTQPVSPLV